jgi:hypothetical protein
MEPLGRVSHGPSGPGTDKLALAALLIWETVGCANPAVPNKPKIAIIVRIFFMVSLLESEL